MKIEGVHVGPLAGAKLVVRIKGPAEVEQIGQTAADLKEIDKVVVVLGGTVCDDLVDHHHLHRGRGRSRSTSSTTSSTSSTTTTTVAVTGNDAQAVAAGRLDMTVKLAAHRPDLPGAYQLVVEVKSGSTVVAAGQTWIGKAAARDKPLDLAFVWPVSLGVHRDAGGVFYDSVIEDALGTTEGTTAPGGGSLRTSPA